MQWSKIPLLPAALLYSAASADIWIGTASGQYACGSSGAGPQQCPFVEWVLMTGEEPGDVCDSTIGAEPAGFPHIMNEQPGADNPDTWDLCGISLCDGYDVVMGEGGNCGENGSESSDGVPDGTDVGECVYEMGNNDNCAQQRGSILAHTWIRCYTDACSGLWGIPADSLDRSR